MKRLSKVLMAVILAAFCSILLISCKKTENITTTKAPATVQTTTQEPAPVTTTDDDSLITYTISLSNPLDTQNVIIVHAWEASGAFEDVTVTVSNNAITFKSSKELQGCVIAVLKEGETTLGTSWEHVLIQSSNLIFQNHQVTCDKTWDTSEISYVINLSNSLTTENVIMVHAWNSERGDDFVVTVVEGKLSFRSIHEYTACKVVVLKDGESTLGEDWVNVLKESVEIPFNEHVGVCADEWDLSTTAIYEFTNTSLVIPEGRKIIIHFFAEGLNDLDVEGALSSSKISAEALKGYAHATIAILNEGETTLNTDWSNVDFKSKDLDIVDNKANIVWLDKEVEYTINVSGELPASRTIIVHLFNDSGSKDVEATLENSKLTVSAVDGFTKAVVAILKADETALGDDWINVDSQSYNLSFTQNVATWYNSDSEYVFTITEALPEGRTIIVHLWGDGNPQNVAPVKSNEGLTLTLTARSGYANACIVVLKEGETVLTDETWDQVKDYQSPDLVIENNAATWNNLIPKVTYSISAPSDVLAMLEGTKVFFIHLWNTTSSQDLVGTLHEGAFICEAPQGYTSAVLALLDDGKTTLGENWENVVWQSVDLTFDDVNSASLEWFTFTVNVEVALEADSNVYFYLFNATDTSEMFVKASVGGEGLVLTGKWLNPFEKVVVYILKAGKENPYNTEDVIKRSPILTFEENVVSWDNAQQTYKFFYGEEQAELALTDKAFIHLWGDGLDDLDLPAVIDTENHMLSCVADKGYASACIAVLLYGESTLGDGWSNVEYQSNNIVGLDKAGNTFTWKESTKKSYTVNLEKAITPVGNVVLHLWGSEVGTADIIAKLDATGKILTVKANDGFDHVIVVLLNEGEYKPIIEDEVWKNIESKSEELAISSYSATWDNRDKQTVTLVLNNGSQNPTVKVSNGEKLFKPENPTKLGYKFINWYTTSDLDVLYDFNNPVTSDFSIFAKWASEYTLLGSHMSYHLDGDVVQYELLNKTFTEAGNITIKDADNHTVSVQFNYYGLEEPVTSFAVDTTSSYSFYFKPNTDNKEVWVERNVTFTVSNLDTTYPFVYAHLWTSDGPDNSDVLVTVDGTNGTFVSNAKYDRAIIVYFNEEKEEFNWDNEAFRSYNLAVGNGYTIDASGTTYTITFSDITIPEGRKVFLWLWGGDCGGGVAAEAQAGDGKLTAKTSTGATGCVVVLLQAGITEFSWDNKDQQSNDVTLTENAGSFNAWK